MAINMHTAGKKADWEVIPRHKWNIWQKAAASTNGLLSPANAVSLIGALLVVAGFLQFKDGVTLTGILLILLGRLGDIIDGYIAHKTGTKSPLGELIDTAIDKFTIFFGLIFLLAFNLLPLLFVLAIGLQSLLNMTASLIGRSRHRIIHPSQFGKLATFLAWFTVISYLFFEYAEKEGERSLLSGVAGGAAYLSFVFFVLLAVHSTGSYWKQLRGK